MLYAMERITMTETDINQRNQDANKFMESQGKVICPECKNYYYDPKKFASCWRCFASVSEK